MEHRTRGAAGTGLLDLYDVALPQVYGYLLRRTGRSEVAEELTSETFLAAAAATAAVRGEGPATVDVPWLIGVARHKLADHWRRQARLQRALPVLAAVASAGDAGDARAVDDPWDAEIDALRARDTLASLAPQHRLALTLRYLDDLPVPEVAAALDRTLHATEALLVRARSAFRARYTATEEVPEGKEDGRA
jgi:RNA polymerase sigma-70 factor, ECF subfamily